MCGRVLPATTGGNLPCANLLPRRCLDRYERRVKSSTRSVLPVVVVTLAAHMTSPADEVTFQNQTMKTYERTVKVTQKLGYLLYLPESYSSKTDAKWPLILFLHGAGERGTDLKLVGKHGLPKIVADKDDFPFIVVSPQCPADQH